jgi:hypothetical protein
VPSGDLIDAAKKLDAASAEAALSLAFGLT